MSDGAPPDSDAPADLPFPGADQPLFDELESLRRLAAENEALSRFAEKLAACSTIEEVSDAVRGVASDLWNWDAFWIAVRQAARGWLEAVLRIDTVDGRQIALESERDAATEYLSVENLAAGTAVLINRTGLENPDPCRLVRFGDKERRSASLLFAPLTVADEVLGAVSVQSYREFHFAESDKRLLSRIADLAAPAVRRCRAERRVTALAGLGLRLSAAATANEAVRVIVDAADHLLGWDACMLSLYSPAEDVVRYTVQFDLIDGVRREVDPELRERTPPSPMIRRVFAEGAQLIIRNPDHDAAGESEAPDLDQLRLQAFGDRARRSASLMFAPVRSLTGNAGVFSLQSYSANAYDEDDLALFQALADHCSGALERVCASEALLESECRFRLLAESQNDGLVLTDFASAIQYANQRMCALTGYSPEEMVGRSACELFLPASEQGDDGQPAKAAPEATHRRQMQLLRRDGSRFWAEVDFNPMRNPAGEVSGSLWAVADVSARKQAEREDEVFSRLKIRLAGADTLDQLGEAARMSADELWDWDALFFSVRQERESDFRAVVAYDTVDECKVRLQPESSNVNKLRPDHPILCEQRWLLNRASPEPGAPLGRFGNVERCSSSLMFSAVRVRGEVVGVLSIQSYTPGKFSDDHALVLQRLSDALGPAVSRCRAEAHRRRTEERHQRLTEKIRDGIMVTRDGRFDFANRRLEEILGYAHDELTGLHHNQVFTAEALALMAERRRAGDAGEEPPARYETTFRRKDGAVIDVEVSVTVLQGENEGVSTLAVVRDVTVRRRREREREILAALGQRLGAITHPREAAASLLEAADAIFSWDAAYVDVHLREHGVLETLIAYDEIQGRRAEVPGPYPDAPGPLTRSILANGAIIILRDPIEISRIEMEAGYGDSSRPSASLMYAVLRRAGRSFGILSIQSYAHSAYTPGDLERLQTLADYGSSALDRLFAEAELRQSEERQRLLIERMPALLWSTDRELRMTVCVGSALNPIGIQAADLVGKTLPELIGDSKRADAALVGHRRALDGESGEYELDIGTLLLRCCVQPLTGSDGGIIGVTGLAHDVTDRRLAEETLAERARVSEFGAAVGAALAAGDDVRRVLQQCADAAVHHLGAELARVWSFEDSAARLTLEGSAGLGSGRDSLACELPPGAFHPDRIIHERQPMRATNGDGGVDVYDRDWAAGEGLDGFLAYPLLVGERRAGAFAVFGKRAFSDADAQAFAGAADGIAQFLERKRAERLLMHGAYHDGLTGLPNRTTLTECLERALAQSAQHPAYSFGILFIDLDRFKVVNDSLGHGAGDQLLILAASRLVGCLRTGDIVARLGGDEFVIFLDEVTHVDDATAAAARIIEAFRESFRLGEHEVFTGASVGIALSAPDYERPEQILRDADIALYRAKSTGRQTFALFEKSMHGKMLEALRLEVDLRRALEREELSVHYQPIIAMSSGRVTAVEALVRWNHPQRGAVPPEEFIPLAEETGLILSLGWWVMEQAVATLAGWQAAGIADSDLAVSVNVSPRQFRQPDLIERIQELLTRTGVEARCLKLEITEGTLMDNAETTTAMLLQLRALDIQLLVDDFGTGHSSLSYLHRFPIHALKVDRSFVKEMGSLSGDGLEIVRSIITLAHGLGMDAIAEGVETLGQEEQLRGAECDFTQGFLFSRPVDAEAMAALLRLAAARASGSSPQIAVAPVLPAPHP